MNQQDVKSRRNVIRSLFVGVFLGLIVAAIFLAAFLMPLPYVVYSPGPTINVLGESGGQEVLTVEGGEDTDTGELRLVTVGESGGPGKGNVTLALMVRAWLTPGWEVQTYESIYGNQELTAEEVEAASKAQMEVSQATAPVAALTYLDYDIDAKITVVGTAPDSSAEGIFEEGDVLVSILALGKEHAMNTPDAPFALMETLPPGTKIEVTVLRGGKEKILTVTTAKDPNNPEAKGSKAGLYLTVDAKLPIDIEFHLEKITGPSAGTIFALGVIDKLTPGSLAGDASIAGTGTVSYTGEVGIIGGIVQKMHGAKRDGAEWFLAPEGNCGAVVDNIPDGLNVVSIDTLDSAVEAVEAIAAGKTDDLPTCQAG